MEPNQEISELEKEISALKETLQQKEFLLRNLKSNVINCRYSKDFSGEEITRYSRQMILPQIGVDGQKALKNSKVLVVGAGGLGCPASIYLVSAGIGQLHIVDYDEVELSNLHRQILHYESNVGVSKARSATETLNRINSNVVTVPITAHANSELLESIAANKFDVILDCSDNVPTRYLINDICVLKNIPLVSGSALQMEGQLTVYHHNGGPCYRCLFPVPPPVHTVTSCGDGGVLGPVCGVIGVLQALEAIKIITKIEGVLSERLLIFDGSESVFRNVKLRNRVPTCEVCGDNPTILAPIDYEQFCGSKADDKIHDIDILDNNSSVNVKDIDFDNKNNIVIDVRPEVEFAMVKLPNTINIPFTRIETGKDLKDLEDILTDCSTNQQQVYLLCRRGNDSQRALKLLKGRYSNLNVDLKNIRGGLRAYNAQVDSAFPLY